MFCGSFEIEEVGVLAPSQQKVEGLEAGEVRDEEEGRMEKVAGKEMLSLCRQRKGIRKEGMLGAD